MADPVHQSTRCECWGGSTYGTEDPAVRLCDLCGGTVPTDPVTGEYEDAKPIRETTRNRAHPGANVHGSGAAFRPLARFLPH